MDETNINKQIRFISLDDNVLASLNRAEINILIKLIDMQPLVVSREILLSSGWPGRVVGPNSLNMAIKSIRTALDTLGESDIIITVPKEGFKLSECVKFRPISKNDKIIHKPLPMKESENTPPPINISPALLVLLILFMTKLFFVFNQPKIECRSVSEEIEVCTIEPDIFDKFNEKNKSAGMYALGRSYEASHTIKEVKVK